MVHGDMAKERSSHVPGDDESQLFGRVVSSMSFPFDGGVQRIRITVLEEPCKIRIHDSRTESGDCLLHILGNKGTAALWRPLI